MCRGEVVLLGFANAIVVMVVIVVIVAVMVLLSKGCPLPSIVTPCNAKDSVSLFLMPCLLAAFQHIIVGIRDLAKLLKRQHDIPSILIDYCFFSENHAQAHSLQPHLN